MITLGLDTSGRKLSAAVVDAGTVRGIAADTGTGSAESVLSLVQNVMAKAGIELSALECIAVLIGPGSFTGLRTGIATALGLARPLRAPIVGISAFRARVTGLNDLPERFIATLRLSPREVSWQTFEALEQGDSLRPVSGIETLPAELFQERFIAIRGVPILTLDEMSDDERPLAASVALAGERRILCGVCPDPDMAIAEWPHYVGLQPLYVKAVNAKTIREREEVQTNQGNTLDSSKNWG